ncbi:protein-tyrosine-phosphatase [Fundidesulfovibrio butyratiphilus]
MRAPAPGEATIDSRSTLILDAVGEDDRPGRFRSAGRFPVTAEGVPAVDRTGLEALRVSGSAQPTPEAFAESVAALAPKVLVVDLREESHLFLDNRPVSLFGWRNWANRGLDAAAIEASEHALARALQGRRRVCAVTPLSKGDDGFIAEGVTERLDFSRARTQAQVLAELGLESVRLPVTDHTPPSPRTVDAFLALLAALPADTWTHLHCHAGEGRTTVFLALYDMLRNARRVAFEDILARQTLLGGADLARTSVRPAWKEPFYRERAALVRRFYDYARTQDPARTTWSQYLRQDPDAAPARDP